MSARDERVAEAVTTALDNYRTGRTNNILVLQEHQLRTAIRAALADDPAQATLARVWEEGYGAGVSAPANRALGLGNPTNPYRAALVPGHDHEGGK